MSAVHGLPAKWREPTPIDDQTLYTMGRRNQRKQCADELEAALRQSGEASSLHDHLLHMLGAKDHVDAGRIIAELHAASMRQSGEAVATIHRDGYWTHEPGRDPFDRLGPNANSSGLKVYTATPATSGLVEALRIARDYAAYANAEPSDLALIDAALAAHDKRGA